MSRKCVCYLQPFILTTLSASAFLLGAQRLSYCLRSTLPLLVSAQGLSCLPDGLRWISFIREPLSAWQHESEFELGSQRPSPVPGQPPIPIEQLRARPSGHASTANARARIPSCKHGCRDTPTAECCTGIWIPQRGCQLSGAPCELRQLLGVLVPGRPQPDHRNRYSAAQGYGPGKPPGSPFFRTSTTAIAVATAFMASWFRSGGPAALGVAPQCITARRPDAASQSHVPQL